MVLGYLLLGWIGGLAAAWLHLAAGGSPIGAAGLFVGVGNLAVIGLAGLVYARGVLCDRKAARDALGAPVDPFPRSGYGRSHPAG